LISFGEPAKTNQKHALVTLFLMGTSIPEYSIGNQESTQGLTNTLSTAMLALRKKLTMMVLFFKYLC
jgi:hypothetical protein